MVSRRTTRTRQGSSKGRWRRSHRRGGWLGRQRWRSQQEGITQGKGSLSAKFRTHRSVLLLLLPQVSLPSLPDLRPAFITDAIAQSEHGIDVFALPMHASAFEASFDHQFVSTLH